MIKLTAPVDKKLIESLQVGTKVLVSGIIYTARDAAHRRLVETMESGGQLPFDPVGQIIYYMGPAPARPGQVIGSAGPTTSSRMDIYSPRLMVAGVRVMIGKGERSAVVREALTRHRAVYLAAVGGVGALIARAIKEAEVIAYEDLGAEALRRLCVEDFPAIVANDVYGGDLFERGKAEYRREG